MQPTFIRTATHAALLLAATLFLAACGSSSAPGAGSQAGALTIPADAPGRTNTLPAQPAAGASRPGQIYSVYIASPTGDSVAFTVFEPLTLVGGKTYPLVLHSHGFAPNSRETSASSDPISGTPSPGSIGSLLDAGYGLISIDERGHGETTGTIRVMDPDFEGKNLLAVLDWAEGRLPWLAYGRSADGKDPHNLIVGSIGGSYGSMYQYLIHNIDPRHRLDAMVPQQGPSDLSYSLFPNKTIKAAWDFGLFGAGNAGGSNLDRGHFDPYITSFFANALQTNVVDQEHDDFFYYHSNQYFCGSRTVASNGGPGTRAEHAPVAGPRVNAMIWQGFRDTLFNFNNAYQNYQCLKSEGGDVRLLSYQNGHNSLQVVPDPGELLFQPPGDFQKVDCGTVNVNAAIMAFFDEYLKGIPGATNKVVPTKPCLSLSGADAVQVDTVTTGKQGLMKEVPSTNVVAGVGLDIPISVPLGIIAGPDGDVIAGIPYAELDVQPTVPGTPGEPIIFVGLGQIRASAPGIYDLLDNQITPMRGVGMHKVDLVGIAERLKAGDEVVLLIYGMHDQYHITGSLNVATPAVVPVTVKGSVWVPMLGNLPAAP